MLFIQLYELFAHSSRINVKGNVVELMLVSLNDCVEKIAEDKVSL